MLPGCPADTEDGRPVRAALSFGERLVGAAPARDTTRLAYGEDVPEPRTQCTVTLRRAQLERLWAAARESYVARVLVDDLPATVALLGVADAPRAVRRVPAVYTRRDWTVTHDTNGAVTDVHANATAPLALPDPRRLNASQTFTYNVSYTVVWRAASPAAPARAAAYRDAVFFRSRAHVFSVFNACCAALFLAGTVVLLFVRRLRSELFAAGSSSSSMMRATSPSATMTAGKRKRRQQQIQQQQQKMKLEKEHVESDNDDEGADDDYDESGTYGDDEGAALEANPVRAMALDLGDESGWKQITNDVFRAPRAPALFAAVVGTGWQLLGTAAALLLLPCLGLGDYLAPGSLAAAAVLVYAVFAPLGGFKTAQVLGAVTATSASGSTGGKGARWVRAMLLEGTLFPGAALALWALLGTVAAARHSVLAPTAGTWALVALLLVLVVLPLTLAGTLLQRRTAPATGPTGAGAATATATAGAYPSQIPPKPWYARNVVVALVAGLPAFGTVAVELRFVCAAYASYAHYYTYGCALAVLACLLAAAGCAAVVATYAVLGREDYRWQWTAFCGGASVGLYALLAMLRFHARSQMFGAVQGAAFLAFALLLAAVLALVAGTAAYTAAELFVHRLYRSSKTD